MHVCMQLAQCHAKIAATAKKQGCWVRCASQLGPHLLLYGRHPRTYLIRANQENSTLITHFLVCVFLS
jgi:hypothetical protein